MKNLKLRVVALFISVIMTLGLFLAISPVNAYAADEPDCKTVSDVVNTYGPNGTNNESGEWPEALKDKFITGSELSQPGIDPKDYTSVKAKNGKMYYYKTDASDSIVSSIKIQKNKETLADLNQFNMKADVGGASALMSGFFGPFKLFLGIIVTLITVGMTIFTGFDLCYIAFPVFRGKMDDAKANGTRGITRTDSKTGETKLNLVTEDAQYAMVAADTVQTGQNPFVIYFKKRVVSFIVLAVLLFVLLTGNINILTNLGVKLADGILRAINSTF